jgi:AraC-like DNA-binding protein
LEIALDSGFTSEHSLIKNFKKTYQQTPTEYRRENRIG